MPKRKRTAVDTQSNKKRKSDLTTCALGEGVVISRLVNGLWQIADMERGGAQVDTAHAAASMKPYVKAGLTTFDMADHYGSAEEICGAYVMSERADVQLLTKWVPSPGPVTREAVEAAVDRALSRLGVASIDLLQFHTWDYSDLSYIDALRHLQDIKDTSGKIKNIGLTNFDAAHLHIVVASGISVVSNQVCYSLLDQRAAEEMTAVCQTYGIVLLCYGTLAGGFLTDRYLGKPEPSEEEMATWSLMKYRRFIDAVGGWQKLQILLRCLKDIADEHSVPIATIATRFVLDRPAVGAVIVGVRLGGREHIAENSKVFGVQLSAENNNAIRDVLATFSCIPGDCGDEYRRPPFLTASGDLSHHFETYHVPYERIERGSRSLVTSGTSWETLAGYSRANRAGQRIHVSGTTSTHGTTVIAPGDCGAQTHFIIDKIEAAVKSLGGTLADVVRTRIFVRNIDDWEAAARAHGARFADIQPANTLVEARLVGEYLVEIEAEAVVTDNA